MHQDKRHAQFEKEITPALERFQDRFAQLLVTEKPSHWADYAGISKSLITNRWKEGSFPRVDNIIKILLLSGFSANWLLLGHGQKFLADTRSDQEIAQSEKERRVIQEDIFELEDKYQAALDEIATLKQKLDVKNQNDWMYGMLTKSDDSQPLSQGNRQQLFNESVLPVLNIIQSFLFIAFKLFEKSVKSDDGGQGLVAAVEWIKRNFEKNNYNILSVLSELDSLLENKSFAQFVGSFNGKGE